MHSIDLNKYSYRTDLILDEMNNVNDKVNHSNYDGIKVDSLKIDNSNKGKFNKNSGDYVTITFKDVTDKDNFKKVEEVLITELKKILDNYKISGKKILVVGLGNSKSTPDALGPKVIDSILVTNHLFEIGEVEDGYERVCSFKPQVTGSTGIETSDMIKNLVTTINADILIVIDALASSSIERVNKTIQISTGGISPGSGVGNDRKEISPKTINIPVIAIGVPTIVDAVTIVGDTLKYMLKKISYKIDNIDNVKLKLVTDSNQDYSNHKTNLSKELKEKILGMVGTLNEEDLKLLIYEVLSPIGYNLMVTPKEIDFVIEKLSLLIANGINKSIHKRFNPTN